MSRPSSSISTASTSSTSRCARRWRTRSTAPRCSRPSPTATARCATCRSRRLKEFHDPTPSPYKLDLKKAEELLDEAGFKRGADKIRFKVPMDFNPIGDESRKVCEFTRAALGRIGITVEIRAQDLSAFSKRIYTDREFDFTYNGHSNLFDPTVGVQRIYWSKNFKKGVPFSNALATTTTPRSTRCSRAPRSRTIRSSARRCSSSSRRSTPRKCRTSASTRRSTSRSRTSACTRIRRPPTASSPTCRASGSMRIASVVSSSAPALGGEVYDGGDAVRRPSPRAPLRGEVETTE